MSDAKKVSRRISKKFGTIKRCCHPRTHGSRLRPPRPAEPTIFRWQRGYKQLVTS
jgi:hypothetical protein